MTCQCPQIGDIEPTWDSLKKRVKITNKFKKSLVEISNVEGTYLHKCQECGQLWQRSHAWGIGGGQILFKVPAIEMYEWIEEQYANPYEIFVYVATANRIIGESPKEDPEKICQSPVCNSKSRFLNSYCNKHHLENLQSAGMAPKPPKGRRFAPYM